MFRLINNYDIGEYLPLELFCIYENKDIDKNHYDLSWLKTSLNDDKSLESCLKEAYANMEESIRNKFLEQFFGIKHSKYLDREAYNNVWKPLYKEFIEPYI